jgi:hypothetical protein
MATSAPPRPPRPASLTVPRMVGRALFGTTSRHPACALLPSQCRCEGRRGARRVRPFPVECQKHHSLRTSRERHCAVAAVYRDRWARAYVHSVLHRRAAGPRISSPPVSRDGEAHPASAALPFGIREDQRGETWLGNPGLRKRGQGRVDRGARSLTQFPQTGDPRS